MSEQGSKSRTCPSAEALIATLRALEAELRAAGIKRRSLFGSVARGDAGPGSDVDLIAELDRAARIDLVRLVGLERQIGDLPGRKVDLLPEPIEKNPTASQHR